MSIAYFILKLKIVKYLRTNRAISVLCLLNFKQCNLINTHKLLYYRNYLQITVLASFKSFFFLPFYHLLVHSYCFNSLFFFNHATNESALIFLFISFLFALTFVFPSLNFN